METHAAKTIAAATDLEALFRALEDLPAPAHVVAVDRECTFPFVAVNRATEELMQMPRARILGTPLAEFATIQPAAHDALAAHRDVVATGRPRTYRTFIDRAEGPLFVQCTLTPLCDEVGLISHVLGIDCEVTAEVRSRAESEAALRRTRDHAASVLAALRDGVVEMDLDQRIVAVNDRFCEIVGRSRTDVLGLRPPLPWWAGDDLARASTSWTEHLDGDDAVDLTYVRPDGSRLPVSVSVAIVRDAEAQPTGWIGLVRDVSERARAQEELQIRAHADALVAGASTRLLSAPAGRVGEVVRDALGEFCGLIGADHAALWQADETERRFRREHSWSHPAIGDTLDRSPSAVAADDMPWADEHGESSDEPMFIRSVDDLPAEAAAERAMLTDLGVASLVSISIDHGGRLLGVITAVWVRSAAGPATETTFPAFRVLGNSLLTALDRARAEDALRRRRDAEALVAGIARDLVAAGPAEVDRVITGGLERTARFVGAQAASLVTIRDDRRSAVRTHVWDLDGRRGEQWVDTRDAATDWIRDQLRDRDTFVARSPNDFPADLPDLRERLIENGVKAIGYLPLRSGGRFRGWVTVVWFEGDPEPGPEVGLPALRVLGEVYLLALDRARAAESLRKSARSLEWAQATAHIGSWTFEPDTGEVSWSDELYRILGFEPGSVPPTPETFHQVVAPPAAGGVLHAESLRDLGDHTHRGPRSAIRPDGEERIVVSDLEVERDADGRILHILGTVRDVTDSVHAQQAVRDSEARFRALVLESGELIQLLDAEGTVLYASPAVERDLGWNLEGSRATDRRLVDVMHPDDLEPIFLAFLEALDRPRQPVQAAFRVRDRHGKWRYREAMLTNLLGDQRVGAVVFNVRDVTERRELEQQLRESQKMEAIGQLAGGIAHDFNNLLTAITGYTALLIDEVGEDNMSMRGDLEQIQRAADRAAALVEQLLQFSRRQPTNPVLLDVNEVIASLGSFFRRVIGEHIRLDTVLARDAGLIRADRSQIEQVVMNFVVNARDAMPAGGRMTIESAGVDLDTTEAERLGLQPGRHLRLDVTDTGSGMDESIAAHVFEPFYTTKGVGEGTGLGLSTVYGIVNQARGHVSVTSRVGTGTTFTVHLPVVEGSESAPTVLVVTGDETTRAWARELLEGNGFNVLEANDGRAARARAGKPPRPDLLLADVTLPDGPGPDLVASLQQHWPDVHALYLAGPVDPDDLLHSVRSALDGSGSR